MQVIGKIKSKTKGYVYLYRGGGFVGNGKDSTEVDGWANPGGGIEVLSLLVQG